MRVLLVGGTFELFRQFYRAQRHRSKSSMAAIGVVGDARVGAAAARGGRHHIGVATDHVIESFRNDLGRATRPAPASIRCCARSSSCSSSPCMR